MRDQDEPTQVPETDSDSESEQEEPSDGGDVIVMRDSPRRVGPSLQSSKMIITVLEMLTKWKEQDKETRKRPVSNYFIQLCLAEGDLPMVKYPCTGNDEAEAAQKHERYSNVIDVLRKRFANILAKISKYGSAAKAKIDVEKPFFDLEETQDLIDMDAHLPPGIPDSQESGSSVRSSQPSEHELQYPIPPPPPRKPLNQCDPKHVRKVMTKLFNYNLDWFMKWQISPMEGFCKMAHREYYHNDRELANTFKQIEQGNFKIPAEVPIDKCVYLKSHFIKTQRMWQDFRIFMKPYLTLPTDAKLTKHTKTMIPELLPFKSGWRVPLDVVAKETVKSLPTKVKQSNKIFSSYLCTHFLPI